ncbi:MAG TPA: aspartyl/asparaginyl beta-hydroxylase domain-containing protein [Pseudomonadales bacterium]|jgi:beta-hydroxylase
METTPGQRRSVRDALGYLFRRAVFWFGFYIRPPIHWFIGRFSKVGNPPVFDPDVFAWTPELARNWEAIRDEALAVLENPADVPPLRTVSPDHSRIATDEKWKVFFLWGYGYEIEGNTVRCPVTSRLVRAVPGLISAFFSIHTPGTHLPRHYGPTNGMITCHLGLQVPEDSHGCRISIDDKDYNWEPGRFLVFDDTYYHEVWNDTDEDRVVLLMHVERPLRQPGKAVADGFLWLATKSPFIQATLKALDEWTATQEKDPAA